jgi:phage anti-repressor protein
MDASLNIVELIENNPITKLSQDYNVKLLTKIKSSFTDFEQQLFLSSFYCYLNYHPTNDFVIDLDNVWKWLGFSQKVNAKTLLEKHFVVDRDYTKPLLLQQKQTSRTKGSGGHNKETFLLNIKTFKAICLKAGTKKADEIHDYYLKMEEMIQEVVTEECVELKMRLEQTTQQLEFHQIQTEKEKEERVPPPTVTQLPPVTTNTTS